ncbi:hypothetical protein BJX96DRAFT_158474 [Aspergillus floccosus]
MFFCFPSVSLSQNRTMRTGPKKNKEVSIILLREIISPFCIVEVVIYIWGSFIVKSSKGKTNQMRPQVTRTMTNTHRTTLNPFLDVM